MMLRRKIDDLDNKIDHLELRQDALRDTCSLAIDKIDEKIKLLEDYLGIVMNISEPKQSVKKYVKRKGTK